MTQNLSSTTLSHHDSDEKSMEYAKTDSLRSLDSIQESIQGTSEEVGLFRDIIKTENDLAGFSIVWTAGFAIVVFLRVTEHDDVRNARWWWIAIIPIAICCLTWIFSYIITKYRKDNTTESMKIPAFILPFICKIGIATFFFGRLFYSSGGIQDRYKNEPHYNGWCDCTMFVIYLSLILSTITTEIVITTVMVNSSQNLRPKIPKKVDVFLFITRPTLWVYNRLIVMFLTFYCFYYVFGIGPLCTSQCNVDQVANVSTIGISIFTLPFHNILYLFKWESFDLRQHIDSKQVTFAVIQQVLIFTTILDLLMDIWSVAQIFKRWEGMELEVEKFTNSLSAITTTFRGHIQKQSRNKPMPQINEEREEREEKKEEEEEEDMVDDIEKLNNNNNNNNNNKNKLSPKQGVHVITDTVDEILEEFDMDKLDNISETEEPESPDADPDVDPNDTPRYNNVESESIASKIDKKRARMDVKPKLTTIHSENV